MITVNFLIRMILLSLLSVSWLVLASEQSSTTDASPKLQVMPDTCVMLDEQSPCQAELTLLATDLKKTNYCIFQDNRKLPLVCSLSRTRIEHILRVTTSEDIDFKLVEMANELTVSKTKLTVGLFHPAQYHKRRRYGWGLI